jgi:hypothetical protein
MSSESEKVVQTTLDGEEYEQFRRIADREGLSLKEALRRAAREFTTSHAEHDPDDPFFAGPPAGTAELDDDVTATKTEAYLYGEE